MSKYRSIVLSIGSLIVLGSLTNAIILIVAYLYMPHLFWCLLITIPLLVAGIYNAKQINRLLEKCRISNLHIIEKQNKYKSLFHSNYSNKIDEADLRVIIGNDQCSQPYDVCILNVCSIKNKQAKNCFGPPTIDKNLDSSKYIYGEKLPAYCLTGGDLVGQIGSDYIGCRADNGNFNSKVFRENAGRPEVKMIELISSTAIKSKENADSSQDPANALNTKKDFPGSSCSNFSDAEGMIHFLDFLRKLSGGKPIGIRLSISDKKEFRKICHAIRKTQLIPDFIVVEGSFENISTAYTENDVHKILPLYEALIFVSQTLHAYGLEKEIMIIASARNICSFDILKVLALGAKAVCTELPAYSIYGRKTFSLYKVQNENDFHSNLMKSTIQVMKTCGFVNVSDITLSKFLRQLDVLHSLQFEDTNEAILYSGTVKTIDTAPRKPYEMGKKRKTRSMVSRFL